LHILFEACNGATSAFPFFLKKNTEWDHGLHGIDSQVPVTTLLVLMATSMRVLLAVAILSCVAAQTFTVNVSGNPSPITFPILNCVGSGHASTTLRADWRSQMSSTAKDIG
jgi:hypothetical protein